MPRDAARFLIREDVERYVELEFPGHHFPPTLPALIHSKTEGSPLFLTDLLRYLRDQGVLAPRDEAWALAQAVPEIERELPASVRSMIQRKIEQLTEADRRLLVAAAVQGQEFDSAVVARALGMDVSEGEERLEALDRVYNFIRLVGEREFPDRRLTLRYRFVHVLYQNALYASLAGTRRVSLSAAVAEALLACYGEGSSVVASELALLFEAGRDFARAVDYFLLAAQNAARLFAHREVILLARRGLELLKTLPGNASKELALQVTLGPALTATRGYAAREVEETYARAHELCGQMSETGRVFPAQFGLWVFYFNRADYQKAHILAEQLARLAESLAESGPLLAVQFGLGVALFARGELERARAQLEQGIANYNLQEHRQLASVYSIDPGAWSGSFAAWTLALLGYPDQALKKSEEAVTLAQQLSQPVNLASVLCGRGIVHHYRGEPEAVQRSAEAIVAVCTEEGFPHILGWGSILRGWALAEQGRTEEGKTQACEALTAYQATGAETHLTFFLALAAQAYGKSGLADEAFRLVEEALDFANSRGERVYEAELYRLKGEFLLRQPLRDVQGAESCFRQAIETARRQSAKWWELRATTSLSRLLQKQGRKEEARRMLAEIYYWFTEGFDTGDLKEAKALLEELSP